MGITHLVQRAFIPFVSTWKLLRSHVNVFSFVLTVTPFTTHGRQKPDRRKKRTGKSHVVPLVTVTLPTYPLWPRRKASAFCSCLLYTTTIGNYYRGSILSTKTLLPSLLFVSFIKSTAHEETGPLHGQLTFVPSVSPGTNKTKKKEKQLEATTSSIKVFWLTVSFCWLREIDRESKSLRLFTEVASPLLPLLLLLGEIASSSYFAVKKNDA